LFIDLSRDELHNLMQRDGQKIQTELHKLFDLCEENTEVKRLLRYHGTERSDLFVIYHMLKNHGANTTINDRYIAASSLIDPVTLRFILYYYKNKRFEVKYFNEIDSVKIIVAYLLHYYEHGDTEGLMID